MKLTQERAVKAYEAIEKFCEMKFSLVDSWRLMQMKDALKRAYDFQVEKEEELLKDKHYRIENGRAVFETEEEYKEFETERDKINKTEIDIFADVILVGAIDSDSVKITPNELSKCIKDLEGIVLFSDPEKQKLINLSSLAAEKEKEE
jgi:hypothetical protein